MHRIVYLSYSTDQFQSGTDIQNILEKAQSNNRDLDVTGILFYCNGSFLQLLEGEKDRVDSLYNKIVQDPRHTRAIKLVDQPTEDRMFGDWQMAYRELDDVDLDLVNEILNWNRMVQNPKTVDHEKILELLKVFQTRIIPKAAS